MKAEKNHTLLNDEPPDGSAPDRITPETPTCPRKKVQCNYWTDGRCAIEVCWEESGRLFFVPPAAQLQAQGDMI